jgi:CRP/FNR family transcriptional regulator
MEPNRQSAPHGPSRAEGGPDWHHGREDFFAGLPREREAFLAVASRRGVKRHEFVFFENDQAHSCYYLQSGAVKIFRVAVHGREPTLFLRHPGEIFGLAEVLGGQSRKCSAQAIADSVIYSTGRADFERLIERHHALARKVIGVLGARLRQLGELVESLMVCDVPTRLLKLFVSLCHDDLGAGKRGELVVPVGLTQSQLAGLTGSCQQTVSEILSMYEKKGWIAVSRRQVRLLDPEAILGQLAKAAPGRE